MDLLLETFLLTEMNMDLQVAAILLLGTQDIVMIIRRRRRRLQVATIGDLPLHLLGTIVTILGAIRHLVVTMTTTG